MGVVFSCLVVIVASSRAKIRPITDTARAASFNRGGMVMTGVFRGIILEVIKRPAKMLPQASRLMGLITAGLFSLMGEKGTKRG